MLIFSLKEMHYWHVAYDLVLGITSAVNALERLGKWKEACP